MDKVKATNTINGSVEFFDTIQDAKDSVSANLECHNIAGDSYTEDDFVIEIKRLTEFTIEVKETLSKLVKVYATDEDEARQVAMKQYDDEEIVLDYGDLMATEFINI